MDSIRASYGQVALVDDGGYFPEDDLHVDAAWFLMDAMKVLGTDAVSVGERDLRFGISFLRQNARRTGLPLVCANLLDRASRKPVFEPYLIKKVGNVRVGFFGLITDKGNLGLSKDSLEVSDPMSTATRTVAEVRRKGATVVVLLSQLGKIESEDLATAVDGIDVVIAGRNVPMLQKGRMVKNSVVAYGGDQGQFVGRTLVTLDSRGRMTTGDNEVFMLGPEIPDKPEVLSLVKTFEDALNEKMRREEKERAAAASVQPADNSPERFLGGDLCARCHTAEAEQWKTTSHSLAWQTLVDAKKDATPDCIPCHVVGFKQPGGFVSFAQTPTLSNVQCENCHGMGTRHDAFRTGGGGVTEETCTSCHQGENDPEWDLALKLPKILHSNTSGETIKSKKTGRTSMLKSPGSH